MDILILGPVLLKSQPSIDMVINGSELYLYVHYFLYKPMTVLCARHRKNVKVLAVTAKKKNISSSG